MKTIKKNVKTIMRGLTPAVSPKLNMLDYLGIFKELNKQKIKFDTWETTPDYYEAAYQKIYGRIYSKHHGIRPSELRRMTLAEIRQRLELHITLEDIDSYNFREWSPAKKLEWLEDLQMFAVKTLGKKEIKKLRGF